MGAADPRLLAKSAGFFFPGGAVPVDRIASLEGRPSTGAVTVKPLVVGDGMLLIELFQEKGVRAPEHVHGDHESIVYLVKGSMKLVIDGQEFIARAGDAWLHPRGVPHWSEALEDCVAIEIKSPPRKTWTGG
jgi:quercetin dioxygenase-like cupin family protein